MLTPAPPERRSARDAGPEMAVAPGPGAAKGHARTRALSVAAICIATVAVVALPWLISARGSGGLGFAAADPTPTVANSAPDRVEPSADLSAAVTQSAMPPRSLPPMYPSPVTLELSQVLKAAALRILPQADFGFTVVGFEGGERLLAPFDVVDNGHGYFVGWAAISNGSRRGQFGIAIWPRADDRKSPSLGCDSAYFPRLGCESRTGPSGEKISIDMGKWENSDTVEYRVKVHRVDGMILMATVTNETGSQGDYMSTAPASSTPPMTADQLAELLLTPGLELHLPGTPTSAN